MPRPSLAAITGRFAVASAVALLLTLPAAGPPLSTGLAAELTPTATGTPTATPAVTATTGPTPPGTPTKLTPLPRDSRTVGTLTAPDDDNFANASTVDSYKVATAARSNVAATLETGEPQLCQTIDATIWFTWSPGPGRYFVSTYGSDFDTVLAVYTGSAVNALTTVACDDDHGPGTTSDVTFTASPAVTYHIQIGGSPGA